MKFFNKKPRRYSDHIAPDEIFLDSSNIPEYDTHQMEGRMEKPISRSTFYILGIFFVLLGLGYYGRIIYLQVAQGAEYREQSENNRLHHKIFFADRGIIYDRNKELLAWNVPGETEKDFSKRVYIETPGFSNLLGYTKPPQKDSSGFYFQETHIGQDGIEKVYDSTLSGENGLQLVEFNAHNELTSESVVRRPEHGDSMISSIDARVQSALFDALQYVVDNGDFEGGAGAMMDVRTGEVIAIASYPDYDSNVMTSGSSTEQIRSFLNDPKQPFLNRVIHGLYAPGSTVKPYVGLGALNEGVVTKNTKIVSTGSITIPNPYFPDKPSVFNDNKAHGAVNIVDALAYSSNVYFYTVGGGYRDQKGIGINNINKYMRMFGFGEDIPGEFFSGTPGVVPNPEWKEKTFDGDPWRIGDTYYTSIGQYGVQTTPLQVVRAVSAIANGGKLIEPTLFANPGKPKIERELEFNKSDLDTIREGMRGTVVYGSSKALNFPYIEIAGKTGTAELGISKTRINSWVSGFFPYRDPKYAFVILLEEGPSDYQIGANTAGLRFFGRVHDDAPEYFGLPPNVTLDSLDSVVQ